jgi:hypothetical protein
VHPPKQRPKPRPVEVCIEPDPCLFEQARAALTQVFGEPMVGRHRAVFRDGDTVIKVPTVLSGIDANCYEEHTCDNQWEPRARAWFDQELSTRFGLPILRMESVKHVGWSEKADWTWSVDCGQVGTTKDGRLVAYDWEHC